MSESWRRWPGLSRRRFMQGTAAAASAGLLARPRLSFGSTPKHGGTIVYAMEAEPDILDPLDALTSTSRFRVVSVRATPPQHGEGIMTTTLSPVAACVFLTGTLPASGTLGAVCSLNVVRPIQASPDG